MASSKADIKDFKYANFAEHGSLLILVARASQNLSQCVLLSCKIIRDNVAHPVEDRVCREKYGSTRAGFQQLLAISDAYWLL